MKKKGLIIALGSMMTIASVAGLTNVINQNAFEAKATTSETTFYVDVTASIWGTGNVSNVYVHLWNTNTSYNFDTSKNSLITVKGVTYYTFSIDDKDVNAGQVVCWEYGNAGNNSKTFYFNDAAEGENLLLITQENEGDWNSNQLTAWGTLSVGETHKVTFDEVGDGTESHSETVSDGDTVPLYTPYKYGYQFDYWMINSVEYDPSTPITTPITLVAHWTQLAEAEHIYIVKGVNEIDWGERYVYSYYASEGDTDSGDELKKGFGAWPGQKIKDVAAKTTANANIGGGSDVYWNGNVIELACYNHYGSNRIIIHDGNGNERMLAIANGAAYFYAQDLSSGEYQANAGLVAKLLCDWDAIFGAAGTICSGEGAFADYTDQQKLETFSQLSSQYLAVKHVLGEHWIDGSTVTSSGLQVGDLGNYFIRYTEQYGYSYDADGTIHVPASVSHKEFATVEEGNGALIATIIGFVSLTAIGGCFFLRRRKEN